MAPRKKSTVNKAGNYTKPAMRKRIFQRIKAGSKGGRPGQWSARKAQMLAVAYKKAGGGYKQWTSKQQDFQLGKIEKEEKPMRHVFLLLMYLGVGDEKRLVSGDMYFRDLNECTWYARELHKQGPNTITVYCLPKLVDKNVKVY